MDYIIVFQKQTGEIFERKRKRFPLERVGDKTNNGWTVLAIRFPYKGKYVTKDEYFEMLDIDRKIHQKKLKIKKWCYENTIQLFKILLAIAVIKLLIDK